MHKLRYDKKALPNFNFGSFSKKKLLLLGFLFVILLVIPLTVYLVQQQQEIRGRANPTTTLSFIPSEQTATAGGEVKFDVWISPGENQGNFINLVLKYDSTKIQATAESFELNPASEFGIIQSPEIGADGDELSVTLSISDSTKVITKDEKIGSVTFEIISTSDTPTQISFDDAQIQIRGVEGDFTENVFTNGTPAKLTILGEDVVSPTPTPSATPTPEPSPELSPTPTSTPSGDGTTPSVNQSPVCQTLNTDRSNSGTSPYSLTFTATGSDTDGTISKVTFNFGDGPVEDVTTGGGIGTSSISLSKAHTYNNAGTFTATSILTDDRGGTSDSYACSVTVTVDGGSGTGTGGSATPLPATGPSETIVGAGVLGGILFLIGTLLFFAL